MFVQHPYRCLRQTCPKNYSKEPSIPYDQCIFFDVITIKCLSFTYFMLCAVLNIANISSSSCYNNLKRLVLSWAFYCSVYSGTEWLSNFTGIAQLVRGRARTRTSHLAQSMCSYLPCSVNSPSRGIFCLS